MALEPPGLEGDGAARDGPVGAVGGWGDAAAFLTGITFGQRCWPSRVGGELTRIHPLHSKGKGCIGDEVVGSPAWVGDNHMRLGDMCQYSCENEQHSVSSSSDRGRYGRGWIKFGKRGWHPFSSLTHKSEVPSHVWLSTTGAVPYQNPV